MQGNLTAALVAALAFAQEVTFGTDEYVYVATVTGREYVGIGVGFGLGFGSGAYHAKSH